MRCRSAVLALVVSGILAVAAEVQSAGGAVTYKDGLVSIRCKDVPLGQVFDQLKAATGLEVILDGAVRNVRLTADIDSQALNFALERLLEGTGLNYAMFLDRGNWQRVAKIYIGSAGGGGVLTRAPEPPTASPRRAPVMRAPAAEAEDYPEDMEEPDFTEAENPGESVNPTPDEADVDDMMEPPASSAAPPANYLPPPPAFPRSSFTPGLDSQNPFAPPASGVSPTQPNPSGTTAPGSPPPAYLPFFDAFGRPIPVNPEQQQQPPQGSRQQEKKPQ